MRTFRLSLIVGFIVMISIYTSGTACSAGTSSDTGNSGTYSRGGGSGRGHNYGYYRGGGRSISHYGGYYRGRGYGSGYYGGYYWGRGYGSSYGVVIGNPYWGASWYVPYYYPLIPYYDPYYYPYRLEVTEPSMPQEYIEQSSEGESSPSTSGVWYFCPESKAYYPYVRECPGGWQKVPAQPPSESGR
jgi:hypothetical protein